MVLGDIESDKSVLSTISQSINTRLSCYISNVLTWLIVSLCRVFNVAYRREPFPAPQEDALRAVQWVHEYIGRRELIVGGVSA
jgi:acetyl esterase/lipase